MAYDPESLIQEALRRAQEVGSSNDSGRAYAPIDALNDALRTTQKGINNWITQDLEPERKKSVQDREKLEVLDGSRQRGASHKAAVRFEDLRALDRFPSYPPNYRYLGAAPNADDYNKLAEDVRRLYEVLGTLASIISTRL